MLVFFYCDTKECATAFGTNTTSVRRQSQQLCFYLRFSAQAEQIQWRRLLPAFISARLLLWRPLRLCHVLTDTRHVRQRLTFTLYFPTFSLVLWRSSTS